jgi:uncharacterized membrane protein YfcA
MEPIIEQIGYAAATFMGLALGLLGGGGSILTVPILVYSFGIPASLATSYSLFIVGVTSLLASIRYFKEKLIDIKIALLFSFPSIIGVFLARQFLLPSLPDQLNLIVIQISKDSFILISFALLISIISIFMFKSTDNEAEIGLENRENNQLCYKTIIIDGLLVGGLTGFVGAGGGFMIVPALTLFAKIPLRSAIATSLLIISAKSLSGFAFDLNLDYAIDWKFLLSFLSFTLFGTLIGASLNKRLKVSVLRKAFALLVFIIGIVILIKEI